MDDVPLVCTGPVAMRLEHRKPKYYNCRAHKNQKLGEGTGWSAVVTVGIGFYNACDAGNVINQAVGLWIAIGNDCNCK